MLPAITNQLISPLPLGRFEAKGCEVFFKPFDNTSPIRVALYPNKKWAANADRDLNEKIDWHDPEIVDDHHRRYRTVVEVD